MLLMNLILAACCSEIQAGKQEVNVQPLYKIQLHLDDAKSISNIIDLQVPDNIESQRDNYGWIRLSGPTIRFPGINPSSDIYIAFRLANDLDASRENFQFRCSRKDSGSGSSIIEYGGIQDNQYCISQVARLRQAPDAFCQPTNQYVSFVIFQKDRLVIEIDETIYSETGQDLVFSKDSIIQKLAKELAK